MDTAAAQHWTIGEACHGATDGRAAVHAEVELEAQELDREELIEALLASWEVGFQLEATFMEFSRQAGLSFRLDEARSPAAPESLEDLEAVFGYEPTEDETIEYMKSLYENATMEIDMDELFKEQMSINEKTLWQSLVQLTALALTLGCSRD